MIFGGNVTVPVGGTVGGSFQHIPACTSDTQVGCVVAYSSFDQMPPADSLFGRPGQGVSQALRHPRLGRPAGPVHQPGRPVGQRRRPAHPLLPDQCPGEGHRRNRRPGAADPAHALGDPARSSTPGSACPEGGATWLQVSAPITPGDTRKVIGQTVGPAWGLHLVDVNIALGNLVDLARAEGAAYTRGG